MGNPWALERPQSRVKTGWLSFSRLGNGPAEKNGLGLNRIFALPIVCPIPDILPSGLAAKIGPAAGGLSSISMAYPKPDLENLMEQARQVAQNSYSPFSRFRVGAALQLTSGEVVTGTNVENVSYGLTICAERAALVSAVSRFGPAIRIAAVAITNLNQAASPPCGACRQVLAEFILPEAPVTFPLEKGDHTVAFAELFPFVFNLPCKED